MSMYFDVKSNEHQLSAFDYFNRGKICCLDGPQHSNR